MSYQVDINCDLGENYGRHNLSSVDQLIPLISSCNIACGIHGGDYKSLRKSIDKAIEYKVAIGAHPSFPDFYGFGRRKMLISADALEGNLLFQLNYLQNLLRKAGTKCNYVKAHGALYNSTAQQNDLACIYINSIKKFNPQLKIMGLAGSPLQEWVKQAGMIFIPEAFADRSYDDKGKLRSRLLPGAIIHDPDKAVLQVLSLVENQSVYSINNKLIPISCQSICIHSDHPNSLSILQKINKSFKEAQINKIAFA